MIIDSVCELVIRGKRDQVFLVVCVLENSLSLWPKRRDASCSMVAYVVPVGTVKRRISLGGSTAGWLAIVHFGSVGRLWGLFERSKAT